MSEAGSIACPHCSAANSFPAQFCAACGLALPSATPASPRFVTSKVVAQTAAGQQLQASELLSTARQAARSLLSIGIINLAFGALNLFIVFNTYGGRWQRLSPYFLAITASMMIAGTLYVAMYYWAKFSPLTATIIGLVVYLGKWVVDIAIHSTLSTSTSTTSTYNYGFVRILMVIYLIRGIGAGWRHRKLELEARQGSQPIPVQPIN